MRRKTKLPAARVKALLKDGHWVAPYLRPYHRRTKAETTRLYHQLMSVAGLPVGVYRYDSRDQSIRIKGVLDLVRLTEGHDELSWWRVWASADTLASSAETVFCLDHVVDFLPAMTSYINGVKFNSPPQST